MEIKLGKLWLSEVAETAWPLLFQLNLYSEPGTFRQSGSRRQQALLFWWKNGRKDNC